MAVETLTVTAIQDQNDGSTTGGLSLRDALMIANANTNNEYIIQLQGGSEYSLTLGRSNNDDVESGDLDIYAGANITIRSLGNEPARINATGIANGDRVFHVLDDGTLTLEKVIVSGGRVSFGGGIYVEGDATLNLLNTTITNNTASSGGGIYSSSGNVSIYNSSIISNTASSGGGIYNGDGSNLTIVNSTISNNIANLSGGGIYNRLFSGNVIIVNSTITDNDADNDNNNSSSDVGGGFQVVAQLF